MKSCAGPAVTLVARVAPTGLANKPFALRQLTDSRCRYGSKATDLRWSFNVRLSPESDHKSGHARGCAIALPSSSTPVSFSWRYRGNSGHQAELAKMSKMTHSDTSRPPITALRTDHLITSSARTRIDWGTVSPSAFAVLSWFCESQFKVAVLVKLPSLPFSDNWLLP